MFEINVVKAQGFTKQELKEIKELAETCDLHEGIDLKLNWEMLHKRPSNQTNDFLVYHNEKVIGFLALYQFQTSEVEISGMVHPEFRRKGIFRALTEEAYKECQTRKAQKLIFICQKGSWSGKSFLEAYGAEYSFSEYTMELQETPETPNGTEIQLRVANQDDVKILAVFNASGFGMPEEEAEQYVLDTMNSASENTLIGSVNGNDIGKISIVVNTERALIYGFAVLPEHRNRGYGRKILAETIQRLLTENCTRIVLEVAAENERALGLYKSCGFREINVNDYYIVQLKDSPR